MLWQILVISLPPTDLSQNWLGVLKYSPIDKLAQKIAGIREGPLSGKADIRLE